MSLLTASNAVAATAPTLGDAASFAVLGASTVTNTGPSEVHGDLGVSPGTSITGFPPGQQVPPTLLPHSGDEPAGDAQAGALVAYNSLSAEPCTQNLTGQDLGGLTLIPGVYCFDSSAFLTGTLTLNAVDGAASVFIFKTESTLITASGSRVEFLNGGTCNGVFWRVGSSATLGTGSLFEGTIVALTSITATTGADVNGRLLALNGAVTLDSNTVTGPSCGIETEPEPDTDGEEEGSNPPPVGDTTPTPTDNTPIINTPTPTDSTTTVVGPGTPLPAGTTLSPTDIVFTSEPGATPTSTTTTSSNNPSGSGESVTFTAVVTPTGSTAVAQGTVTFFDGSTVLGSVPLKNGKATFTTSSLIPGDHPITAVFHGGPGLTGSISRQLTQKVTTTSTATKVVTTTHQQLVNTGANILPLGLSALTALLIGSGFLLESRRRAKKTEPVRIPKR
jgi:type VI secretion system secreted protein VgrG